MRGSAGELGLKASGSEGYFGLIYIGDTSSFKKLVEEDDSGIVLEEDAITGSLFAAINEPESSIEVLIGAKNKRAFGAIVDEIELCEPWITSVDFSEIMAALVEGNLTEHSER